MVKFFKQDFVKIVILMFAVLYSLSHYMWGIWLQDNFYWINLSKEWQNSAMCVLSMWCINVWHSVFGFTLFSDRILAWLLNDLTVFILYCSLLNREQRKKQVYYLCAALVIMGPGISKCCTPDCFTSLLASLLLVMYVRMLKSNHQLCYVIVLSVISALEIAARFPNLLFIPLIPFFMVLQLSSKAKIQHTILYITLSIAIYWGILMLFYQDTNAFSHVLIGAANTSNDSNGRHTLIGLLLRYCKSILLSVFAVFVLWISKYVFEKTKEKNLVLGVLLSLLLGTSVLYNVLNRIGAGFHSWSVCLVSFDAVLLGYLAFKDWKKNNLSNVYLFLFVLMFSFVPSAGSDTGFQKSMMIACALMPVVVLWAEVYIDNKLQVALLVSIVSFTSHFIFCNCNVSNFVISKAKATNGILMDKWSEKAYGEILDAIQTKYCANHSVFYGYEKSHYLYLATGTKPLYKYGFWQERNDSVALNKAIDAMGGDSQNVLFDFTFSDEDMFTKRGLQLIEENKLFNAYSY